MLIHIANVLDTATVQAVAAASQALVFQDGKSTAGWHAKAVKNNQQAAPSDELTRLQEIIVEALGRHPVLRSFAMPAHIAPPLISRTGIGEGYGTHVDDAIMGAAARLRTDLSITLFLSDPAAYDGGELVVETAGGEDSAKFPAGDAAVYASTSLHRVEPVVRGERLVAATWVQSLVRDAGVREMLFDLDRARRMLFEQDGKSPAFDLVSKTYSNLLRRHAEL